MSHHSQREPEAGEGESERRSSNSLESQDSEAMEEGRFGGPWSVDRIHPRIV